MQILWVKIGGLWPLNTGGRLRSFHLLSELSRWHQVTVLTTHGPADDPESLARQLPACTVISIPYTVPKLGSLRFVRSLARSWFSTLPVDLSKFRIPALAAEVRRLIGAGNVDLCVADFLSATPNIPLDGSVPVLFFAHNVEYQIWRRLRDHERSWWRRALLELEWRKMRLNEARICTRSQLTVSVSDADCTVLSAEAPAARICAVPTGVDTSYFSPSAQAEAASTIVFCGSMDWHPNEDAVLYFLEAILPRIRQDVPDASFLVVGRNPTPALLAAAAAQSAVCVTGTVDDVRPYLAGAAIVVVPLRIGGGTRLKIFEALAMQKAVVSTTVGAEGLPMVPGTHYLQEDNPAAFARAVVSLLKDPDRRRGLAMAGRQLVEERYSWSQVARAFEAKCQQAVSEPRRPVQRARWAALRSRLVGLVPRRLVDDLRAIKHLRLRDQSIYWRLRLERALKIRRHVPHGPQAGIRSVLFVCSGNIIRSPMAGALLTRQLSGPSRTLIAVASAGLHATAGRSADPRAQVVAREFGVSLDDHRAEPVTDTMVRRADLILAMDCLNEAELLGRFPDARHKIYPLGQWTGGRPPQTEIVDPYDGEAEDIRHCYQLLESSIWNLTSGLRPAEPKSY